MAESDHTGSPDAPRRTVSGRVLVALALAVLLVAALAGAGAGALRLRGQQVWASSAVLLIDQEPALSQAGSDGVFLKLSRLRAKYAGLVRTQAFAQPVAEAAGLPVGRVQSALSATASPTDLLLTITARTAEGPQARDLAQVAADQLVAALKAQQTSVGVPVRDQVTLTVVTPAGPAVKLAPARSRAVLVAGLVLLAVAVPGLLAVDVLRRRAGRAAGPTRR